MNEENDLIKDMIAESGLDPVQYTSVADALATLRSIVPAQAPAPSAELAALLSGGTVTALSAARLRKRRIVLASGALAATVVLGTGVAAASNTLPEPAQRLFNDFSEKFLPFEFPSPDERSGHSPPPGGPGDAPKYVSEISEPDNGNHIGGGTGAGKTDNLGQHNGPEADPDKPATPTPTPNAKSPGKGQGNDNGQGDGRPDAPPVLPSQAATPTAKPTEPPRLGEENRTRPPKDTDEAGTDDGKAKDKPGG